MGANTGVIQMTELIFICLGITTGIFLSQYTFGEGSLSIALERSWFASMEALAYFIVS